MEGNDSLLVGANQWPGQAAGYIDNVEVDFFEADYVTKPTAYAPACMSGMAFLSNLRHPVSGGND